MHWSWIKELKLNSVPRLNTLILIFFLAVWGWTELQEHLDRAHHRTLVDQFIYEGGRFTTEDGQKLEKRIEALEKAENDQL